MTSPNPNPSPLTHQTPNTHVSLSTAPLNITQTLDLVRSPCAGALVVFAGTTRNATAARPVASLTYTSYAPLALKTMAQIAASVRDDHALSKVALAHRLGPVPVGEESIVVAVSAPHRGAAWRAGEEALERCKERVEVWKREVFADEDGDGEEERGVWRANRDTMPDGRKVDDGGEGMVDEEKVVVVPRHSGDGVGLEGKGGVGDGYTQFGPVVRPRRLGERGHGPVVNPKPPAPPEPGVS